MKNKITFGTWEASSVLINAICAKMFLNHPRSIIEDSGTAAWMQVLYLGILAFLVLAVILKLYRNYEGMDLLTVSETIGGAGLRIFVGLFIFSILLFSTSVILREYAENVKVISLPSSPISFVTLFFLAGIFAAAYFGIEAITRFHAIVVPFASLAYLLIAVAVIPFVDIKRLTPILGNGLSSIFWENTFRISIYAPIIYLFFMPPFLDDHRKVKTAGFWGMGIGIFFLTLSTLVYSCVIPYPASMESFLPTYQIARMINYGRFFQRVESLFLFAWALSALMHLSVLFYFSAYVFQQTFRLKYYRPLVFPLSILVFSLSLYPENLMSSIRLEVMYYAYTAWIAAFALPLIVLTAGWIVKKRKVEKGR